MMRIVQASAANLKRLFKKYLRLSQLTLPSINNRKIIHAKDDFFVAFTKNTRGHIDQLSEQQFCFGQTSGVEKCVGQIPFGTYGIFVLFTLVTVIDGNQSGSVVKIPGSAVGPECVLEGFTITNGFNVHGGGIKCTWGGPTIKGNLITGNTADYQGGGIYCGGVNGYPVISDNIIIGNGSNVTGAGIYCAKSAATIRNNTITENQANHSGGGMYITDSLVVISGNIISKNSTPIYGGGVVCNNDSDLEFSNNLVYLNSAQRGGGFYCSISSSPNLYNNTFSQNSASSFGGGIIMGYDCFPTVTNTVVWNNTAPTGPEIQNNTGIVTFSDVKGGWPGLGNIDQDPLFVNPAADDYHLAWTSPCINRGTNVGAPVEDFEGDARPFMGTVDMGADEFTGIHPLEANVFTLFETTGGTVSFTLNGGTTNGNRFYVMLGSITGNAPGTPLPGGMVTLAINWDVFTNLVMNLMNSPVFMDFSGQLDAQGQATATFDTLGPFGGAVGLTLSFAYGLQSPWDFASNPINVEILP
jgi:hypothetical protein